VSVAVLGAVDPKLTWYVARASGIVAWLLCAAAVAWGLVLSGRLVRRRGLPAWLSDLHAYLGTLALVFTGVHLGALALDDYVHFGWRDLFVPMAASWRPGPVAWGIVAAYLLAAVQLTSWLKRRLPRRWWLTVHRTATPVLMVAGTVHGVLAGTDRGHPVVVGGAVAVGVVVAVLLGARLRRPEPAARAERPRRTPVPTAGR